ncbi:SH3 domain-containing protein [Pseudonocardia sp. KRD-184]|uniref:SH3 domain-containing protein n=1 Tax=Pseudonocardia oceani TaxID=2792013 RepID=A0ABS6UIZ0_9PSEU|nr:SH3 domain-containing protein [Pseudonocardia oceani]MBW0089204.1 SH3 domain-containing protein [Pseudonocardia oceani]MBW0096175.1 SH3 domain-containing protein [Pseudonocardia oceani]MBW0109021.1 SH3 domain-containing protein [Pseudonocardia oceani]MBW0123047.1 SH3 domain-containing protein [Pseudonocardia oceani]MBW0132229.1 SH3 domain-containing protein [Pseudonocardia oceani]
MMARPGRTAAVVGAVVAVSATTLMGVLVGTASAVAPGRCVENVNVRAEPSIDSRIVAVCEAGTAVETGRIRDGFVQLTDQGGWASEQYVSVGGAAPATGSAPSTRPAPTSSDDTTSTPRTTSPSSPSTTDDAPSGRSGSGTGTSTADDDADSTTDSTTGSEPTEAPEEDDDDSSSGVGGLLG